jgi:hypothetical protein
MRYGVIYRLSDGQELQRVGVADSDRLELPEAFQDGNGVIEVPAAALASLPTNFALVRAYAHALIDGAAEAARLQFITPGAGQAISYLEKRREAEAFLADAGASTPIISAEAVAVGKTREQVVAEVIAMRDLWIQGEALVNALRLGSKKSVNEAPEGNFSVIASAVVVDWQSALGALLAQANAAS